MDPHTLELLEFPKILAEIAGSAATPFGRERVLQRRPGTEPGEILSFLGRVSDARTVLDKGLYPPLEPMDDVRGPLDLAAKGAALPAAALRHAGIFLRCVRLVRDFLREHADIAPSLQPPSERLRPMAPLESKILKSISIADEILDG